MSVLIKGMEMPKDCEHCRFCGIDVESGCWVKKNWIIRRVGENRPSWCPLVDVPTPHGRLIDGDVLIEFIEDRYEITWEPDCYEGGIKDACCDILEKIDAMPTIIEAEE